MADTKPAPSATSPTMVSEPGSSPIAKSDGAKSEGDKIAKTSEPKGPAMAFTGGPPMGLRALVGFSGLSLLVGFFLPWFRAAAEGEHDSGMTMMLGEPMGGTPAIILVAVPILGVLLSALAFMGFRWTAHAAIAVASLLLAFGLWILLQLFVEHTALGLWVVVGGTFITLLLGISTLLYSRDRATKQGKQEVKPPSRNDAKA